MELVPSRPKSLRTDRGAECEVKKYKHLLQRIKYAVDSDENVKEKIVHILNPPKLKTYNVTKLINLKTWLRTKYNVKRLALSSIT